MSQEFVGNLANFKDSVMIQYGSNIDYLAKSLPSNLLIFPLCNFLMSPSQSNAIFLYGALFLTVLGIVTSNASGTGEEFLKNMPSFHGMALGYYAGYKTLQSAYEGKTAYVLSSVVFCIILTIILTAQLYGMDTAGKNILNVGLGSIIGFFTGCLFSHFEYKTREDCPEEQIS